MKQRPVQIMAGIIASLIAQTASAQTASQTRLITMPGNEPFQNDPRVSNCGPEHPKTKAAREAFDQEHPVLAGKFAAWAHAHNFNVPGTYLKCTYHGSLNDLPPTVTVLPVGLSQ